jgi:hypothetical protein
MSFDSQATQIVDAGLQEERRQALSAAAAARAPPVVPAPAPAADPAASSPARQSLPRATPAQKALLDRAVRADATNWMMNRIDPTGVTDVRVTARGGNEATLRGEYSYNSGSPGWVEARLSGGRIACLRYHDRESCAPPRPAATVGAAANAAKREQRISDCIGVAAYDEVWHTPAHDSPGGTYHYPGSDEYRTELYVENFCSRARRVETRYSGWPPETRDLPPGEKFEFNETAHYRDLGVCYRSRKRQPRPRRRRAPSWGISARRIASRVSSSRSFTRRTWRSRRRRHSYSFSEIITTRVVP